MNSLSSKKELIEQLFEYLGEAKCACHIIDCNKTRILMWRHKTSPNTFLLKIADQFFISSLRSDKNNETYWKYRNFYEWKEKAPEVSEENPPTELTNLAKFNQRQTKTESIQHERNNSETATSATPDG